MLTEYTTDVRNRAMRMILVSGEGLACSEDNFPHNTALVGTFKRWQIIEQQAWTWSEKFSMTKAAKIIIAKSFGKAHKTTRILTQELRRRGIVTVSHVTLLY